ncbi:MAG: N-acetylmuramoyl-L-alanine amidase [Bacteroidales bacterium]|nr:N-acetylmuramoyl-L-alanine amidase [Bacteroidales bacterium]
MDENILLYKLIVKLAAILGASLLIERILSFLNLAINRMFLFQYSNRYTQVEKLQEQLRREKQAIEEDKIILNQTVVDKDPCEVAFNPALPEEKQKSSCFDLLLIRPLQHILDDNERYIKYKENNVIIKEFWMQILGTLIAIFVCRALNFSIWEFFRYYTETEFPNSHSTFEYIFTGIIIGAGSKPINFLMNFLVNRKIEAETDEIKEESKKIPDSNVLQKTDSDIQKEVSPTTKEIEPETIEDLVGFEYDGGNKPDRLENTHKYTRTIDLIVYHHTAMHSDAPFEEVVKEFDRKGWLTGYNCVVFKDGTIRVLCRWDRFGNHAKPHNSHSFGIAFQGNFEPNPNIPFSNPNGDLGLMIPSGKQLLAAARVIAMYALLQNIPFTFPESFEPGDAVKGIIPHHLIADKACPGGNFPHDEFKESITNYYNNWKDNAGFKKALELFKKKPMVIA